MQAASLQRRGGTVRRVAGLGQQGRDDRDDDVAMSEQPTCYGVEDPRNENGTENGRSQPEQQRAAERIAEMRNGVAGKPSVEPLHSRDE